MAIKLEKTDAKFSEAHQFSKGSTNLENWSAFFCFNNAFSQKTLRWQ